MKIYGLKDLEYYRLCERDIVIFHVKNKQGEFVDLKYEVHSDFLMNILNITDVSLSDKYLNDAIFTELGLDPHKYCSKHYGYEAGDGIWPCYKVWDFEAATNVVKALYTLIDTMNGEWLRVKGDFCTNMIWNGKEFGYNDSGGDWISINVGSNDYTITSQNSASLTLKAQGTTSYSNPHQESLIDMPVDKLKKIASQIKTIKEDNNSKLKRI